VGTAATIIMSLLRVLPAKSEAAAASSGKKKS
jgi:hypothetical protein